MNAPVLPATSLDPRRPWLQFGDLRGFHWTRYSLPIPNLPSRLAGLRIVHLTDTHIKPKWNPAHSELIDRLKAHPPDLILFSGDFVDNMIDPRDAMANVRRFVSGLTSRVGTFGITGNHDGDLLVAHIDRFGVPLLNDRLAKLQLDDAEIELIGLPGPRRRNFDPAFLESIPERRAGVPRIVLAHYPDQILLTQSLQAELMLSGHTHGGQICLPNGRALLTHDTLPKPMAQGSWQVGHTRLIVSRGLGWTRWPIRICCPAEVVEITLNSER